MRAETARGNELRRIIESHFECCSSTEIGEAIKHLRFHNHDLVLCQLPLDDESAFGFLRSLQADNRLKTIPTVCINVNEPSPKINHAELETASHLFGALACIEFKTTSGETDELLQSISRHIPKLVAEEKGH